MKKVLVIGGGFIGGHLIKKLIEEGHKITLFDTYDKKQSEEGLGGGPEFIQGSIEDSLLIEKIVAGKDCVVNLASIVDKMSNEGISISSLKVNCLGELNVLEAIRKVNPECHHIFLSSRAIFGKIRKNGSLIDENQKASPFSFYAINKYANEKYIEHYKEVYGVRSIILRPSSVYGVGVSGESNNIIPFFVKKALMNEDLVVYGDGQDIKDFIYVEDLVELLANLINDPISGVYNVGNGKGIKMQDIALKIKEICESKSNIKNRGLSYKENLFELDGCVMNIDKIKKKTGWSPKTDIEEGISKIKDFYRQRN